MSPSEKNKKYAAKAWFRKNVINDFISPVSLLIEILPGDEINSM